MIERQTGKTNKQTNKQANKRGHKQNNRKKNERENNKNIGTLKLMKEMGNSMVIWL